MGPVAKISSYGSASTSAANVFKKNNGPDSVRNVDDVPLELSLSSSKNKRQLAADFKKHFVDVKASAKPIDEPPVAEKKPQVGNNEALFAQAEWRFASLYGDLIQGFVDSKEMPLTVQSELQKLQSQMQALLAQQRKASDKVFAQSFVKKEKTVNQRLTEFSDEIEQMKQEIDQLSEPIHQIHQEDLAYRKTLANQPDIKNGVAVLGELRANLSAALKNPNYSYWTKRQIRKQLFQLDTVNQKFESAKSKVFKHSRYKTEREAQGTLFEMRACLRDVQKVLNDPEASVQDKQQARIQQRKFEETIAAITQLQQRAKQAAYAAIEKRWHAIDATAQKITELANQHLRFTMDDKKIKRRPDYAKLIAQLKPLSAIDVDTLAFFSGLIKDGVAAQKLHELQTKREEMVYRLARAKAKKEELIQIQYRAQSAGYLAAWRAVTKMRDQAFDIAHQIRRGQVADRKQNTEIDLTQIHTMSVDAQLDLLGVELGDIAKRYKAESAEAMLKAHTLYEKNHALAVLLDNAPSGTAVSSTRSVGVEGGVKISVVAKVAEASATGSLGLSRNESYSIDYDTDINYLRSYAANFGLNFNSKFLSSISVNILSKSFSKGFITDFFEAGRDSESLEAARRFATLANNQHNWIIRGPLRSSAAVHKIYAAVRTLKNKIGTKFGRCPKDPYQPFWATEKVFADARRRTQSRFMSQQLQLSTNGNNKPLSYFLEQSYRNDKAVPLSLPAAISATGLPEKANYTGTTMTGTNKAGIGITYGLASASAGGVDLMGMQAGAKVQGSTSYTASSINVERLDVANMNASTAATGNIEKSQALTNDVLEKIWDKKSLGGVLPGDLSKAKKLFVNAGNTPDGQAVLDYLKEAGVAVESLNARLDNLEQLSADLSSLVKYAKKGGVLKALYQQKSEQLRQYQLPQDRLDPKQYTKKGISYAIGRAWGNTDSAGLMISQGVTSLLNKHPSSDPAVQQALDLFDAVYANYLERLQNFNAPYTKEGLFRFAEIQALSASVKRDRGVTADLSAGLTGSSSAADAAFFGVDIGVTRFQFSDRLLHANDLREGKHETRTATVSVSNLDKVLASLFSKPGTATLGATIRPAMPAVSRNFFAGAVMQILGLSTNTLTTNYSTLFREGIPQAVLLTASATNQMAVSTPNLLSAVEAVNYAQTWGTVSISPILKLNASDSFTQTNAVLIMLRDYCFNILQTKGLREAGLSKSVISKMKSALLDHDIAALMNYQQDFFNHLRQDQKKMATYFLGDAIDGVLTGFVNMDRYQKVARAENGSLILKNGFELLSDDVSIEYAKMQRATALSAQTRYQVKYERDKAQAVLAELKKQAAATGQIEQAQQNLEIAQAKVESLALAQLAQYQEKMNADSNPDKDYISRQIGVSQAQVKALLEQKLSAGDIPVRFHGITNLTVADFLKQATYLEKVDFYQHHPIGAQLFAAYSLIVNQGDEVRLMYMSAKGYQRTVSLFSQNKASANGKLSLAMRAKNWRATHTDSHNKKKEFKAWMKTAGRLAIGT